MLEEENKNSMNQNENTAGQADDKEQTEKAAAEAREAGENSAAGESQTYGISYDPMDGSMNGHMDGSMNGSMNGSANGSVNGSSGGSADNRNSAFRMSPNGEYSYVPYVAPETARPAKVKKAKKPNRGGVKFIAVLAAVLVCAAIVAGAGFGGTYLANRLFPAAVDTTVPGSDTPVTDKSISLQVSDNSKLGVTTVSVAQGELMSIAQTVAAVKDSVVEIRTETTVTGSRYSQYVMSGAGSGVIISADGFIVTNNHVIEDTSKITVRLTDGSTYDATLIGADSTSDIAVIKITPDKELTVAVMGDSTQLVVGQEIIVIGNPLGELGGTVTNGIISALEREVRIDEVGAMKLLQTNAAVNPGNSGGGMFNLYGELVGIVNAKSSGDEVEGLGFAIPVNGAVEVIEQLVAYGYVRGVPTLNITLYDATDSYTAAFYFRSNSTGTYIIDAASDSGFSYGDRIISVDGTEVSTSADVTTIIRSHAVGDTVDIVVARSGKTHEVKVTLAEYVPDNITK